MNIIPSGKRLRLSLLMLALLPAFSVLAQHDNVWVFGYFNKLDFTGGTPTPLSSLTGPNADTDEGCASYCDAAGNLLFYSNGWRIRDRNNNIMPNGNLITTNTYSTTQASLIVPRPGSTTRFYVFSLEQDDEPLRRLFYSEVDMSLNGGLGDVVTGQKGILVGNNFCEKMTAVAGGCDKIWLMTRSLNSNEYKAYPITSSGIGAPVISTIGTFPYDSYSIGTLKFSPDGKKMAAACHPAASYDVTGVELYDFNDVTGVVSNVQVIDMATNTFNCYYGACFSPDNTKLYATVYTGKVYQYDITLGSAAAIAASRFPVFETSDYGVYDMKVGGDNKMYIATIPIGGPSYNLHRVNFPNLSGAACQFVMNAITFPAGAVRMGLPNAVIVPGNAAPPVTSVHDTTTCTAIELKSTHVAADYTWSTGATTATITVHTPGTYWVRYEIACISYTDTFKVHTVSITPPDLGPDVHACEGDVIDVPMNIVLSGTQTAQWSDGSTGSSLTATEPGTYWVRISDKGCSASDTLLITRRPCDCFCQVPSAFSPNNDARNDVFTPIVGKRCPDLKKYTLSVYNRWGELVYTGTDAQKGWDGNYRGQPADMGTYMYVLKFYNTESPGAYDRAGDVTLIR